MTPPSLTLCALLTCALLIPAQATSPSRQAPAVVYVDRFSTQDILNKANDLSFLGEDSDSSSGNHSHLLGDLLGPHKAQQEYGLLQKLPTILQKTLVQNLNQGIARAAAGDGMLATQLDCWVIRGRFVVVDGESRAGRTASGQSHVEIHARIYTLSDPDAPFLTFNAKGVTGHMPGQAAANHSYAVAVNLVMTNKEPEKEVQRVGRQIAEELGKFMTAQNIPTLAAMKTAGTTPPPSVSDDSQVSPVYSSKGNAP